MNDNVVYAALHHRRPSFGRLSSLWHRVDLGALCPDIFVQAAVGSGVSSAAAAAAAGAVCVVCGASRPWA